MEFIEVKWKGVAYSSPYRVYDGIGLNEVLNSTEFERLGQLSRHHNGHVRQSAIERLLRLYPVESVPYVVQLLSEYVVEVAEAIHANIPNGYLDLMRQFLDENPVYTVRVRSRVTSYWNCYDRNRYPHLNDSPAFRLLFSRKRF